MNRFWICLSAVVAIGAIQTCVAGTGGVPPAGAITIGYRETAAPFSFLDTNHRPAGFTVDLCRHVVDTIRKSLSFADLKVNYVLVSPSNRVEMVKEGLVDLECGATTVTSQRSAEVSFSRPIFIADTRVLVRADSGIQSLADLKARKVIVNQGSAADPVLARTDLNHKLHIQFVRSRGNEESFNLLERRKADAFVHDDVQLATLVASSDGGKRYILLDQALSSDPIAIMMRKENVQLRRMVDSTLSKLVASGEFDRLYAKWFVTPSIRFPMGESLRRELHGAGPQKVMR